MKRYGIPVSARSILVFGVGTFAAYGLWDHILLPFSDPMEVVGPPLLRHWNPLNDIARSMVFVLGPSLLLAALFFSPFGFPLGPGRPPDGEGRRAGPDDAARSTPTTRLLLVLSAALISLNVPTYHAFGLFDPFHEGESLGAAMSSLDQQVPYRDFFFFHGVFQDPLRSLWAFQWFGRSIGAQRTLESIMKVGTWVLLALALEKAMRPKRHSAFVALLSTAAVAIPFLFDVLVEPFIAPHSPDRIIAVFNQWGPWLSGFHWVILSGRDILPMALFLVFLGLLGRAREGSGTPNRAASWPMAFLLASIPWLGMAYSVDRGIYLMAVGTVFCAWFLFCFNKGKGDRVVHVGGLLAGGAFGIAALGMALQWNYAGFAGFVFGVLPRYKLMTDELPYPIDDPRFLASLGLLSFGLFLMTRRFLALRTGPKVPVAETLRVYLLTHGEQSFLLMMAFCCFRNVLERPVLDHLAYNFIWTFLFYVLEFRDLLRRFSEGRTFPKLVGGAVVLGVVLLGFCAYRLAASDQVGRNFPLMKKDEAFLSEDRRQVMDFLRKDLKEGEPFFAFTCDASWYYLLDRASPTAFPCLWVAAPMAFQLKVIESLERKQVRIVLYKNDYWGSSIDDIPDSERFPAIDRYLREHYVPYRKVADQEIWTRKGFAGSNLERHPIR